MRFISRISLLLITVLFATGCMTVGNTKLDDVGNYMSLREGESTKADVYDVFGQPHDVRRTPADESMWVYYRLHTRPSAWTFVPFVGMVAGGHARDMRFAYFSFDVVGTLIKVMTESDSDYENTWAGLGRGLSRASDKSQAERVAEEMRANGFRFDPEIAKKVAHIRDE